MIPVYTPISPGEGTHFSQGYAGVWGDSSEPISMVQCGCPGPEGWHTAFLCRFQAPQCTHEERFIPTAMDSGGPGEHGGVGERSHNLDRSFCAPM